MGEISPNVQVPLSSKKQAGLETQRQRAASAELLKGMKIGMSPARLASSLSTEDFKAAWENLEAFLESKDEKNTPENLGRLEEVETRSRFAFQELKNPVMGLNFVLA
jgi:Asp-tRNA(Asn)/Glu-tRNA(Gln) amidotransferase A subunit family amidase